MTVTFAGLPGLAGLLLFTDFTHKISSITTLESGVGKSLMAILVLGTFSTAIALIFFNKLIKKTSAVFASSVTYLIPVFAIAWAIVDGEALTAVHFMGLVAVLGGIFLINIKK